VPPVDSSYGSGCCFLSEEQKGLLERITTQQRAKLSKQESK